MAPLAAVPTRVHVEAGLGITIDGDVRREPLLATAGVSIAGNVMLPSRGVDPFAAPAAGAAEGAVPTALGVCRPVVVPRRLAASRPVAVELQRRATDRDYVGERRGHVRRLAGHPTAVGKVPAEPALVSGRGGNDNAAMVICTGEGVDRALRH